MRAAGAGDGRKPGGVVKTYTLYLGDRRYSVPTLLAIDAVDDSAALAEARRRLGQSAHYYSVEIWEDERLVGQVEADGPVSTPEDAPRT